MIILISTAINTVFCVTRPLVVVKATFHLTIFDIPMRHVREDQRHRRRFTRKGRPAIPVMVIIPLNFARCTLITHGNRQVKSSLNRSNDIL